jgi:hypothetical protein
VRTLPIHEPLWPGRLYQKHILRDDQEELAPLPNEFPALSGKFSAFLGRLELSLLKQHNSLSLIGYGAREELPRSTGMSESALGELSMTVMLEARELRKTKWMPEFHQAPDFSRADVQAIRDFTGTWVWWGQNFAGLLWISLILEKLIWILCERLGLPTSFLPVSL